MIWTGSLLQWFLDDLSFTFNAEDDRRSQLFIRGVVIPLIDIQCCCHDWPQPERATWFDGAQGLGRCRLDLPLSIIDLPRDSGEHVIVLLGE